MADPRPSGKQQRQMDEAGPMPAYGSIEFFRWLLAAAHKGGHADRVIELEATIARMEASDRASAEQNATHARLQAIYPYLLPVLYPLDGSERPSANTVARRQDEFRTQQAAIEDAVAQQQPRRIADAWPYYFVHPPTYSHGVLLPALQQRFLESLAPRNRALVEVWMHAFDVNFNLTDSRASERTFILYWAGEAFEKIRALVANHPDAATFTDLLSLLPAAEAAARAPAINGEWNWDFYTLLFMPGPRRLGVPLPVGLVLFEGRGSKPTVHQVLQDRLRRPPFSTSWHPNVALDFTRNEDGGRDGGMFAHKLMSDGILGVNVQDTHADSMQQRRQDWYECEVIVQPLVSFHQVDEAWVLLDKHEVDIRSTIRSEQPVWARPVDRNEQTVWVHVVFTHAFLGDVCPCEAHAEATESASSSATDSRLPMPDAKRQRLQGRLQLD